MEGKNLRSMFTVMIWDTKVLIGLNVLVSHRESIVSSCSHPTSKTSVSLAHAGVCVLKEKALHE